MDLAEIDWTEHREHEGATAGRTTTTSPTYCHQRDGDTSANERTDNDLNYGSNDGTSVIRWSQSTHHVAHISGSSKTSGFIEKRFT